MTAPDPSALDITQHVKGNVTFDFYRAGNLYYRAESGLIFPVPIADADENSATFMKEDKAIFFMRWIRKFLMTLKQPTETPPETKE